jgi:fructokinase
MPAAGHIAVIGETVADAFLQPSAPAGTLDLRAYPGGGPANTAVALGRLGTPTYFVGRLSTGVLGRLLRDHLAASHVDLSASVQADGPAALAVAAVDEHGRASYDFYLNGATDWQWRAEELARLPADAMCLHTGSLALALQPGGPLIEDLLVARRRHATVCIDPNVRLSIVDPAVYPAAMARWCQLADIIRLSEEDLPAVTPGLGFEEASRHWHEAGVRLVVLTRGGDGATASLDGTQVTVPAVAVDPIDTVGAGDAFTAGLLHILWYEGHLGSRLTRLGPADVARAMEFAAQTAALTCAVRGADPPWRHRLARPTTQPS